MLKLFKTNFKTTNDCIILAAPLVIFITLLRLYITYAINSVDTASKLIWGIVTAIVMFSGFLSAWLYMTKKTIALSKRTFIFNKDRVKALGYLTFTLTKGIGRLFLPILCVVLLFILFYSLTIKGITYGVEKHFGALTFNSNDIISFFTSDNALVEELYETLTIKEITAINTWYIAFNICIASISFFTLLWIPEIVYAEKNPLKALMNSCKKMIQGLPETILLFFFILMITLFSKFISMLILLHPILYFVVLIYYYYYIVYIIVLLFSYYEQRYID